MATPARSRQVYRGEALRALAFPLGGLGTGSVAVCGDGSLRQWQLSNRINHLACVPQSFFAIWAQPAQAGTAPVARVLQSAVLYKTTGPQPPPTSNDHLVPEPHRRLLEDLPGVATTEFIGEYPVAELTYRDPGLPLEVGLEAFSPFIPLNSSDSGLPVIFFNFTVTNTGPARLAVSLAATLQNSLGWDGLHPLTDTHCGLYGGNTNTLVKTLQWLAIEMRNERLPDDDPNYGSFVLAARATRATSLVQWDDLHSFWADFATDGQLSQSRPNSASPSGQTWNGALAVPFELESGATQTITFLLAWHFPNRYFNYNTRHAAALLGFDDPHSKFWVGNHYAQRFGSASEVADYAQTHQVELTRLTRLARDTFYTTSLPASLIDSVTSQISVLRSPTCFRTFDGRFYGYEGCSGASTPNTPTQGSCPLNCTHVWNYEMALARLFPDLERTMRETEWEKQQHASGYLPHRVRLPLYLPRPGEHDLVGPDRAALDGLLGGILKTYREYRADGDLAWLGRMWPGVKRALNFLWSAYDPEHQGIITGEQPNTYDISIYGLNPFIGSLYLAALGAIAAMAERLGDAEGAVGSECLTAFERGRATLEARSWNGEYYQQDVDLKQHPEQNWASGCHSDQLLGQWWAYQLGLGNLLQKEHSHSAVRAIYRHNFRQHFRNHLQRPRVYAADNDPGLLICTWPRGGRPAVPTQYSDEIWTGLEYEVAALLLYEGEPDSALRLLDAVRTRYDGCQQNPWNNIECGDHYVRALSAWSLLEAASGFSYDAGEARLAFAPNLTPADYQAPFVCAEGWGTFAQRLTPLQQTVTLHLAFGNLRLQSFCLRTLLAVTAAQVTVGGQPVAFQWSRTDSMIALSFNSPLSLSRETDLRITLADTQTPL